MSAKARVIYSLGIASLITFTSSQLIAQTNHSCGVIPIAPDIIDGSSVSIDALVANSKDVNLFIEQADEYLDCQTAFNDEAKKLPKEEKAQRKTEMKSLLKRRNDIGDEFNAQVAAYREANPE